MNRYAVYATRKRYSRPIINQPMKSRIHVLLIHIQHGKNKQKEQCNIRSKLHFHNDLPGTLGTYMPSPPPTEPNPHPSLPLSLLPSLPRRFIHPSIHPSTPTYLSTYLAILILLPTYLTYPPTHLPTCRQAVESTSAA